MACTELYKIGLGENIMAFLLARIKEPSTWAGLAAITEGLAQVFGFPMLHGLTLFFGAIAVGTKD
jgi:hypothetical protein